MVQRSSDFSKKDQGHPCHEDFDDALIVHLPLFKSYIIEPLCRRNLGSLEIHTTTMSQHILKPITRIFANQEPRYYLNKVDIDVCGSTLTPGKVIFLTWTFTGSPGYESCYAAVRPISDLHSDEAIVAQVDDPHPQCGGSSTNIKIPQQPINSSFPFDRSEFIVRVNTNDTNGIYADSCTFRYAILI